MQQRAEKRPSNSVAAKEIISRWRRLVKANRITTNEADDFVNDKMMGWNLVQVGIMIMMFKMIF